MTRPSKSSLVLDGSDVKLRLEAERAASKSPVHVDWVRFTCLLRKSAFVSVDKLFPKTDSVWDAGYREAQFQKIMSGIADPDFSASQQALDLAQEVAAALGSEFSVLPEVKKGHDFYRFRWSIERCGAECGWVGYLSSGDSPRQSAQGRTIHANIYGHACTFADSGWTGRIADIVELREADLTRCDLALDFFDGLPGGFDAIVAEYHAGAMNVGGKKLKSNCVGDWLNGHERSLYFGSKESGKQTNVYEKGDQLFGVKAESKWLRAELRYGNKLRELPVDMLRRPADFFAGASPWHAALLLKADAIVSPEPVRCAGRLAGETVKAEVSRVIRWAKQTAAPTLALLSEHLDVNALWELIGHSKLPGRLQKFSPLEIKGAFFSHSESFSSVGSSPAFA